MKQAGDTAMLGTRRRDQLPAACNNLMIHTVSATCLQNIKTQENGVSNELQTLVRRR